MVNICGFISYSFHEKQGTNLRELTAVGNDDGLGGGARAGANLKNLQNDDGSKWVAIII
jgi:hypothetical protein